MEFAALIVLLAAFAVVLARTSGLPLWTWFAREVELAAADFWTPEPPVDGPPFTRADPRARRMEMRQRVAGVRLRRQGVKPRVGISSGWQHDERAFKFARADR